MLSASGVIVSRLPEPPAALQKPALFLDLDGVLAPLEPTPDAVGPDTRRTEVLRRLKAGTPWIHDYYLSTAGAIYGQLFKEGT